jgi:hypothetical protein
VRVTWGGTSESIANLSFPTLNPSGVTSTTSCSLLTSGDLICEITTFPSSPPSPTLKKCVSSSAKFCLYCAKAS